MEGLLKEMHRLHHEVSEQSQVVKWFNGFHAGASVFFLFFFNNAFLRADIFLGKMDGFHSCGFLDCFLESWISQLEFRTANLGFVFKWIHFHFWSHFF